MLRQKTDEQKPTHRNAWKTGVVFYACPHFPSWIHGTSDRQAAVIYRWFPALVEMEARSADITSVHRILIVLPERH